MFPERLEKRYTWYDMADAYIEGGTKGMTTFADHMKRSGGDLSDESGDEAGTILRAHFINFMRTRKQ